VNDKPTEKMSQGHAGFVIESTFHRKSQSAKTKIASSQNASIPKPRTNPKHKAKTYYPKKRGAPNETLVVFLIFVCS
jgi:hypothetical protein